MLICDEQGLLNKDLTVESTKAFASFVAETVPTGSNFRGGAAYRTHLIKALVDRSVTELGGI
jgi:CO/xanthine dehydrogenase FAD-binding subunit